MGTNWGVFLCNCRRTVPLEPERLILPTAPSVLYRASDPDSDAPEFAARARHKGVERVLVSCCGSPDLFEQALGADAGTRPKIHFLDLTDFCFRVHGDLDQAHRKASRLLRAAMEDADADEAPTLMPLKAGGRILIATDLPEGLRLADDLKEFAEPILVVSPEVSLDAARLIQCYRGRVIRITGHLSNFQATIIEDNRSPEASRREVKADQVVVISRDGSPSFKARTGCHILADPSAADLHRLLEHVRELTGEFLKQAQVNYNPEICAGGTANQEACGICITACPYDAIGRDPENHLRMRVDHMACEACGACVSACPTTALRFTDPSPRELYTKMAALLNPVRGQNGSEALTILFHCGEQGRRVLDEAGRRPLPYPATVLPLEVPCLRYVSDANMLAVFRLGAAGVGLLGCETCQHGERELLYQKLDFCRLTLNAFDLDGARLRLITANDNTEAEAIRALSSFAGSLTPTPVHWDGKPMRQWDNREVITETIGIFIDQLGRQPGRKPLDSSSPFALAEVRESGCTMCRSCVNVCPTHAFEFDETSSSIQFKHIACVACGLCETACPEKVITLKREIYFDRKGLEYRTVAADDSVSCAKCGKPYINRRALEIVEARLFSLESLLDTFTGERRNLLRMCPDCRAVSAMLEVEKGWKP